MKSLLVSSRSQSGGFVPALFTAGCTDWARQACWIFHTRFYKHPPTHTAFLQLINNVMWLVPGTYFQWACVIQASLSSVAAVKQIDVGSQWVYWCFYYLCPDDVKADPVSLHFKPLICLTKLSPIICQNTPKSIYFGELFQESCIFWGRPAGITTCWISAISN